MRLKSPTLCEGGGEGEEEEGTCSRVCSFSRVLDGRARGCKFDPWGWIKIPGK